MLSRTTGQEVVTLPREILERAERVLAFHRASNHTHDSVRALSARMELSSQPSPHRVFPGLPKVLLPTGLLDIPVAALALMRDGLGALPESHIAPPQDLKTLATWLFMAYGVNVERKFGIYKYRLRTCPSASALYPCEIYVAAFGIDGLEPGLYCYQPREFVLTKLREGAATLSHIKRGRPELEFLKSVPAALLVSTIFGRTAWKYHGRGYRVSILDAGHLIANLVASANGLGIQTMTRLKMNDNTMRELIGVPLESDFGAAEAVQAMVVWADDAAHPIGVAPRPANGPMVSCVHAMPPIEREPLSSQVLPCTPILAVHRDCAAPGIPIREVRPPLTELSPLPAEHPMQELPITETLHGGPSLRQVLLKRRSSRDFTHHAIPRNRFLAINQSAFRTGTFIPLHPDGPHPGLVRPFWVIHDVTGLTSGIWYYHPQTDRWVLLRRGDFRSHTQLICLEQPRCGNASAVCILVSNLHLLLQTAGPDLYRLAHLEAGIAGHRLTLAAAACGFGSCGIASFYDDEVRQFLGLQRTGWEVLYATAIGVTAPETEPPPHPALDRGN